MNCARRCLAFRNHVLVLRPLSSRGLPTCMLWRADLFQNSPGSGSSFHTGSWSRKDAPSSLPDFAGPQPVNEEHRALLASDELFEQAAEDCRDKATFQRVLATYSQREVRRRGHVEFIYTALRKMPEFGVERDLAVYNKLLDVFPKEVFVPRNYIQRMFNHFPRQQECAIQVLEQMENYGIMPDVTTKVLLVQIFGSKSHPMRKYQRLLYWFPRFKHANPFPVPDPLPRDPVELASLALLRIAPDLSGEVTVYQVPHEEVDADGRAVRLPHIVGLQSPEQQALLAQHDPQRPVFVEGPFPLWLRRTCLHYYLLRSDPLPPELKVTKPVDPERNLYYPLELNFDLDRDLGDDDELEVEEVDEGPVFALCQAGSGDPSSLARWVCGLQTTNPLLGRTPVLFRTLPTSLELEVAPDGKETAEEESGSRRMRS